MYCNRGNVLETECCYVALLRLVSCVPSSRSLSCILAVSPSALSGLTRPVSFLRSSRPVSTLILIRHPPCLSGLVLSPCLALSPVSSSALSVWSRLVSCLVSYCVSSCLFSPCVLFSLVLCSLLSCFVLCPVLFRVVLYSILYCPVFSRSTHLP